MKWKKIGNHHKDGSYFIAYLDNGDVDMCRVTYKFGENIKGCRYAYAADRMATHWMPLPEPPENTQDE